MPTRYTLKGSGKKVYEELEQAYLGSEIAPTAFVPAICRGGEMKLLRWGYTPQWAKEDFGGAMANVRREKVFFQTSFKGPVMNKRCLIPATAFFEWRDEVKYRFSIPSMPLFYFAGIWDDWIDPNGSDLESCAILNTYPNSLIIRYKAQMPCILRPEHVDNWMNFENSDRAILDGMLRGIEAEKFRVERC
jgi:putative SOS response-associated peptidase YedK